MFVIGITGGIGCGKSTIADICKKYGIDVIDADEISKAVTKKEGAAIDELVSVFGKSILDSEGNLDRTKTADIVFKDRKQLDVLSKIIHKYVVSEINSKVVEYSEKKKKVIVLDVPIPVKNGFIDLCNQIWVVWCDEEIRIDRLKKRGMTEIEAKRRIKSQMSRDEYMNISDYTIDNSVSIEELNSLITKKLDEELSLRGIRIK